MSSPKYVPLSAKGTTLAGESSQGNLKRKWRQSSSSSFYNGPVWKIERSRIGCPSLSKLPIETFPIRASEEKLAAWRACRDETQAIVIEEALDWKEVGIYIRKGVGDTELSPTLLISLRGDLNLNSAKSVLITIGHMLHERKVTDLLVEIADPRAYRTEEIFPIKHCHPLVELWPRKLRAIVLDMLDSIKFTELGVYNYGFTAETAVPTITITVKNESSNIRDELKSAIIEVCASHGVPNMRVATIYGEAKMYDRDSGDLEGYQSFVMKPNMGHSIGTDSIAAGTLGGYIIIIDHKNNTQRPVILTCWHVLRPDVKHLPQAFDAGTTTYGQWPQVTLQPEEVHSPSRRHVNNDTRFLQDALKAGDHHFDFLILKKQAGELSRSDAQVLQGRGEACDRRLSKIRANIELLWRKGEVFAQGRIASGYRVTEGHALDWAIAEPTQERTGENDLPSQERLDLFAKDTFYLQGKTKVEDINREYKFFSGESLFKKGCTTGLTNGFYNGIEASVVIELPSGESRMTHEHTIVSRASSYIPFSKPGDSGSWILNANGHLVGLLWGGSNNVGYFTHIGLLLNDIEARTGWNVKLP